MNKNVCGKFVRKNKMKKSNKIPQAKIYTKIALN